MTTGSGTGLLVPDANRDWQVVLDACVARLGSTDPQHNLVRLFHGRGKTWPGFEDVTVDRLGDLLLIGLFAGADASVQRLVDGLVERRDAGQAAFQGIALQVRQGRQTAAEAVWGEVSESLIGVEAGLQFALQPLRNQNVGLFLDAAPLRSWVREWGSRHPTGRVLNLFAYTCGFSVAALAGGAASVVNNDMSRPALDTGRRNHELNEIDAERVRYVPHNLFRSWWKLKQFGPYDLCIIDPPTHQRGSFHAERQYATVLRRVAPMLAPHATLVACLNSPFLPFEFLTAEVDRALPEARFSQRLPASADFPEAEPERALKVAIYTMP